MRRFDTPVLENRELCRDYRRLSFVWPEDAGLPDPGRFLTVRASAASDPLLRRPFAFSGYDPGSGSASLIYQVRGPATRLLAALGSGAFLDVLGPLGRGFPDPAPGSRPVLLGGGIGLGPLLHAAGHLGRRAAAGGWEAPVLVLGFRGAAQIPDIELPEGTAICTDDGSAGFRGTVIDWASGVDSGGRYGSDATPVYYACGPVPMMAALDRLAASRGAPYWAAVEQWMACGVGACMGCAVRLKDGSYVRACADGPVFDGALIDWERT